MNPPPQRQHGKQRVSQFSAPDTPEAGRPGYRRDRQPACRVCNQKKGAMTDLEYRELNRELNRDLNRDLMPLEDRTPPARPIDTERIRSGV